MIKCETPCSGNPWALIMIWFAQFQISTQLPSPCQMNLVIVLLGLPVLVQAGGCRTESGAVCVSPFIYEGSTRSACITTNDPEGRLWCSTATNQSNHHIIGASLLYISSVKYILSVSSSLYNLSTEYFIKETILHQIQIVFLFDLDRDQRYQHT